MKRRDYKEAQLTLLQRSLARVRSLSAEMIAAKIVELGFACQRCGECCTGEENSVAVFPFEVRAIQAMTGGEWQDEVEPPKEGEWDCQGRFHTLEWRLRKVEGSCKFYTSGRCRIYESRPLLCRTYPFYLDEGILRCSQCRGLGSEIDPAEARRLAALLIERSMVEIAEAVALLEKYEDFERGRPREGGDCIVHDSEGEHLIKDNSS